jgi:Iap family predicted aminopeptidase
MKRASVLVLLTCALLLLLLPVATARAATTAYDLALDKLVADGYPQGIEGYLDGLGTSSLGFRLAGTSADNDAATYLADEMEAVGLQNVRLEPVPVDAWGVKEASVTVGALTFVGSQFAGVPPTGAGGVTGEVVYVGNGTAAEFDAAGDVTGKLVVVDSALDMWWLNFPGAEAALRGAKGVIMTYGPDSSPWYEFSASLGGNDGEYLTTSAPMVYISRADGAWLKAELKKGPVTATMTSEADVQMAADGGTGYNVVGELPGSSASPEKVLIASHHDAHFRAGLDDTGAVAAEMAMAKAMVMSGYTPRHTIVFMITTGEEFGYTNCWFDWSIGAWYAITHTHPEWAGQIRGFLNLEAMARTGARMTMRTSAEMVPWLATSARRSAAWLPYGYNVSYPAHTWNDEWTFTAAGVPSVTFGATGDGYDYIYHTDMETKSLVDWSYVAGAGKFVGMLQRRLDSGILPYSLAKRADDLAQSVGAPGVLTGAIAAGANKTTVLRLSAAASSLQLAAARYEARRAHIPASHAAAVTAKIIAIEKELLSNFTALDAWDYTCYPHQQVIYDALQLKGAIAALTLSPHKPAKALTAISNVGTMWYGLQVSNQVYGDWLALRAPGYPLLTWGAQGHRAMEPDLTAQYLLVKQGKYAAAAAGLKPVRMAEVADLNARLAAMTKTANHLAKLVNELR